MRERCTSRLTFAIDFCVVSGAAQANALPLRDGAPRQPLRVHGAPDAVRGAGNVYRISYTNGIANRVVAMRGAGNSNAWSATRALVEDEVAETGVYVPSLRARYLARRPQSPERLERKGDQRRPA